MAWSSGSRLRSLEKAMAGFGERDDAEGFLLRDFEGFFRKQSARVRGGEDLLSMRSRSPS